MTYVRYNGHDTVRDLSVSICVAVGDGEIINESLSISYLFLFLNIFGVFM